MQLPKLFRQSHDTYSQSTTFIYQRQQPSTHLKFSKNAATLTVITGKHRAQEIDRETALQTSQNEETDRIPFTLTYHPQNLAIKYVILKNFKILRNDPETELIFSLPPLISFKL